jgi:hypothetical protein
MLRSAACGRPQGNMQGRSCQINIIFIQPRPLCGHLVLPAKLGAQQSCVVLYSADGEVLMSSLTLVLDGVLIEPPPPTLPLSATVQGSIWALATLGLSAAGTSNQAGNNTSTCPAATRKGTAGPLFACCLPVCTVLAQCAGTAGLTGCCYGFCMQVCRRPLCWWMTASSYACRTGSRPCCRGWLPCSGMHSTRYSTTNNWQHN